MISGFILLFASYINLQPYVCGDHSLNGYVVILMIALYIIGVLIPILVQLCSLIFGHIRSKVNIPRPRSPAQQHR